MRNNNKRPQYNNKNDSKNNDKSYTVSEEMGLLDFLYKNMNGMSANKVKSTLKYKLVSVDGKIQTKFDYELKNGQVVTVHKYTPVYTSVNMDNIPEIIFEDDDIIVINKPSGLLTIATEDEKDNTAYHIIMEYVRSKNPRDRIFIVHRLDRDTSGVLMFAKNEELKMAFQEDWDNLVKYRGYTALVEGCPDNDEGRVESWLRETDTRLVYSARSEGDGKHAITNYRVTKKGEFYSLVDVDIETGRKNQIRVHMKDIGCSVAGDKKYGAETNPIRRLCLHAHRLAVTHPFTDEILEFSTPIPKKFLSALKTNPNEKPANEYGYKKPYNIGNKGKRR